MAQVVFGRLDRIYETRQNVFGLKTNITSKSLKRDCNTLRKITLLRQRDQDLQLPNHQTKTSFSLLRPKHSLRTPYPGGVRCQ